MALAGADVLIYPTPSAGILKIHQKNTTPLDAWITIQRSHAVANGIPVISCNRVGFEQAPDSASALTSGATVL